MFIFEADDKELEYYSLVNPEGKNKQILEVSIYLDRIFIPLESYSLDRLDRARKKCQEFLELDKSIFSILIKSSQEITIWITNERFRLASCIQQETAILTSLASASELKCLSGYRDE